MNERIEPQRTQRAQRKNGERRARFCTALAVLRVLCVLCGSFFFLSSPGFAFEENSAIMAVNRSVGVSWMRTNLYYIEPSDGEGFPYDATNCPSCTSTTYSDYERGDLDGARISASWMIPAYYDLYLHAEWSGVEGLTSYTGFFQSSPPTPAGGLSRATVQEYGVKIGRGFATGETWMVTPYFGLGGRYWRREIGVGEGSNDFMEIYNHFYFAFGSLVQHAFGSRTVFTGDASIGRTFGAWISAPGNGLNHTALGVAPIIQFGGDLDYRITSALHFFTGVDYTYFSYGQTGVQMVSGGEVLEPISHTEELKTNFGLRLSF